jgi:hypothetical protein
MSVTLLISVPHQTVGAIFPATADAAATAGLAR